MKIPAHFQSRIAEAILPARIALETVSTTVEVAPPLAFSPYVTEAGTVRFTAGTFCGVGNANIEIPLIKGSFIAGEYRIGKSATCVGIGYSGDGGKFVSPEVIIGGLGWDEDCIIRNVVIFGYYDATLEKMFVMHHFSMAVVPVHAYSRKRLETDTPVFATEFRDLYSDYQTIHGSFDFGHVAGVGDASASGTLSIFLSELSGTLSGEEDVSIGGTLAYEGAIYGYATGDPHLGTGHLSRGEGSGGWSGSAVQFMGLFNNGDPIYNDYAETYLFDFMHSHAVAIVDPPQPAKPDAPFGLGGWSFQTVPITSGAAVGEFVIDGEWEIADVQLNSYLTLPAPERTLTFEGGSVTAAFELTPEGGDDDDDEDDDEEPENYLSGTVTIHPVPYGDEGDYFKFPDAERDFLAFGLVGVTIRGDQW
jgi:hypothetical protein